MHFNSRWPFHCQEPAEKSLLTATEARMRLLRWKISMWVNVPLEENWQKEIWTHIPQLLLQHRRARFGFPRECTDWTVQELKNVLMDASATSKTIGCQEGSIMVERGIFCETRTGLVVFDWGNVTAQKYMEDVLQDHAIPFHHHSLMTTLDSLMTMHFAIPPDSLLSTLMGSGFKFYNGRHKFPMFIQLNTFGTTLKNVYEQECQPLWP